MSVLLAGLAANLPEMTQYDILRESLRNWNRGDSGVSAWWLAAALGAVVAITGAIALGQRLRARWQAERPTTLFHGVARQLAVPWRDQWLLIRISRSQRLPSPLTLLVCPATLRHHAAAFAAARPPRQQLRVLARVGAIQRRLFGGG